MVFQFTCENKKCRSAMEISGQLFLDAMAVDKAKSKGRKPKVGVRCHSCGRVHNLVAPAGLLDGA